MKACQLRCKFCATILSNLHVEEYLLHIKSLVDSLAYIGDPISSLKHIDVVIEGIPHEFGPVISVVEIKFESI